MNIFILDPDLKENAIAHCDKHVVKMILEHAQMLSTAFWVGECAKEDIIDRPVDEENMGRKLTSEESRAVRDYAREHKNDYPAGFHAPYMPTHINHPCNIWARTNDINWHYLWNLTRELNKEYMFRFAKENSHKAWVVAVGIPSPNLPCGHFVEKPADQKEWFRNGWVDAKLTPFAKAMPEEYLTEDTVEAYRKYYIGDKQRMAKWTRRAVPYWYELEEIS